MTSEVAVGNSEALVFGADTKVTVPVGPPDRPRRGTEAAKIHVLQDDPPCALMIYDGTRFGRMSWAALAHEYRRQHLHAEPTVRDTASRFLEWLDYTPVLSRRPPSPVRLSATTMAVITGVSLTGRRVLLLSWATIQPPVGRLFPVGGGNSSRGLRTPGPRPASGVSRVQGAPIAL